MFHRLGTTAGVRRGTAAAPEVEVAEEEELQGMSAHGAAVGGPVTPAPCLPPVPLPEASDGADAEAAGEGLPVVTGSPRIPCDGDAQGSEGPTALGGGSDATPALSAVPVLRQAMRGRRARPL